MRIKNNGICFICIITGDRDVCSCVCSRNNPSS